MALTGTNAAINKLQVVLADLGLENVGLPQIAVVGSQSTGKSSVLESLVGHEFLPRGAGIVTRRPLILQLEQTKGEEYAQFGHKPGTRFDVGASVRDEIVRETDRVCPGLTISSQPIVLRIYSPTVLNLTLIDLPGITRVQMEGQPANIVQSIRDMVLKFIEKDSCLILAVSPANIDIANSDALQMAKMMDPRGQRTIAVLTKLDLMDEGTDAADILTGRVIALKHGVTGVVNRSQADIDAGKTIKEGLIKEQAFFASHPAYAHLVERSGSQYLSKTLSTLLSRHVRAFIPTLRNQILSTMALVREEMEAFGGEDAVLREARERDKGTVLLQIISKCCDNFLDILNGRHYLEDMNALDSRAKRAMAGEGGEDERESLILGGARVNWVFHEMFQRNILGVQAKLTPDEVRICMRNMTGIGGGTGACTEAFEVLVKAQIQRLEGPSLECIEQVQQELHAFAGRSVGSEAQRYPSLCRAIVEAMRAAIAESTVPLAAFVRNLIKREVAYINTQNPEFYNSPLVLNAAKPKEEPAAEAKKKEASSGGWFSGWGSDSKKEPEPAPRPARNLQAAAKPKPKDRGGRVTLGGLPASLEIPENASASQREHAQVQMVQNLTIAYFRIVKKNVADGVPKAIMYFLINRIKANLQKHLLEKLYHESTFTVLMAESDESLEVRRRATQTMELLKAALASMDEVKRDVM